MKTEPLTKKQSVSLTSTKAEYVSDFGIFLQQEFRKRSLKNQRYSLRSFARFLEIEASSLSQMMKRKRKVSQKMIHSICDKLLTHPAQRDLLLKNLNQSKVNNSPLSTNKYIDMSFDIFNIIADWHHIAILDLTQTEGFQSDPKWISSQLGISIIDAQSAIDRLLRVELLEIKQGQLKKTHLHLSNFKTGTTSSAHKLLQKQIIEKALQAVDGVRQEEKDITSIFMAIDESKLPEARMMIQNFRRELCAFLETGKQTRVYNLAVQLFPLSKTTITEKI